MLTLRLLLLAFCCLLLPTEAAARIALVYNGGQDVFQQFADALTPLIRSHGHSLEHHDSRTWPNGQVPDSLNQARLLIVAGADSTALLAKQPPTTAMLHVLLSRQQFEQHASALRRSGRALSAIYQDPPTRRQLRLSQLLLPGARNVGFLYQPSEAEWVQALRRTSEALGLKLIAQPVASDAELPAALVSVVNQSDLLLASANSALYNRYTIKTILTATYRQEKVLIGSSPAFVKAGSLATTYSSVQHIAVQVHEVLTAANSDGALKLPPAQYARYFDLSLNADVARSLNIRLPDNDSLLKTLIERDRSDEAAGVDHE